ncbi:MAG TPA: hypothetical protein VFD01_01660 [Candidatus Dormibacteraeota bacterium]|nr:hypothetical protein [Candidatus Dormibacteraeota bacterium]
MAASHPGVAALTTQAPARAGAGRTASMERVEAVALEVGWQLIRALAGWWLRAREERVHRQLPVGWKVVGERQRTVSSRVGAVLPASQNGARDLRARQRRGLASVAPRSRRRAGDAIGRRGPARAAGELPDHRRSRLSPSGAREARLSPGADPRSRSRPCLPTGTGSA